MLRFKLFIINSCRNMDRNERIIRLLSLAAEGKRVQEEGIGSFNPDDGHWLGNTYFI